MVVGFCEDADGTTEGNLHVGGLELAVREVSSKFQVALDVVGLFLNDTPSF